MGPGFIEHNSVVDKNKRAELKIRLDFLKIINFKDMKNIRYQLKSLNGLIYTVIRNPVRLLIIPIVLEKQN